MKRVLQLARELSVALSGLPRTPPSTACKRLYSELESEIDKSRKQFKLLAYSNDQASRLSPLRSTRQLVGYLD